MIGFKADFRWRNDSAGSRYTEGLIAQWKPKTSATNFSARNIAAYWVASVATSVKPIPKKNDRPRTKKRRQSKKCTRKVPNSQKWKLYSFHTKKFHSCFFLKTCQVMFSLKLQSDMLVQKILINYSFTKCKHVSIPLEIICSCWFKYVQIFQRKLHHCVASVYVFFLLLASERAERLASCVRHCQRQLFLIARTD